jgi:AraC-like DNA-binding protein
LESLPLIRASQIRPFVGALEQLGLPVERHLRRARLPLAWQERPDSLVAEQQIWWLAEEVTRAEGVGDFGVRAGVGGGVCDIGPFGLRLTQSVTLRDALETLAIEVGGHSSHARFGLTKREGGAWFWRAGVEGIEVGRDPVEQYTLLLMIQIVQLAAGPGWRPRRLRLKTTRAPWLGDVDLLHDARAELGAAATALAVPAWLMSQPLARVGARATGLAAGAPVPAGDFTGSLRQVLESLLGQEPLRIGLAADLARTSVRTLERRLQEAGVSWRRLVDQIHCDAAVDRLRDPARGITDIAYELGYSDSANFTRAFRRWAGVAPSAFRHDVAHGD